MRRKTKSLINLFLMLGVVAGVTLVTLFMANRLLWWIVR